MPTVEMVRAALPGWTPTEPACPHFGTCGGCSLQDVAYADQVRMKRGMLETQFGMPVEITPSPDPFHYRQRMDYVFAFGKAGLRERGRKYDVVDLEACPLVPPRVFAAFTQLRQVIRDAGVPDYDYRRHEGVLRYLVFRYAATTDQLLITVVATHEDTALEPVCSAAVDMAEGVALSVTTQRADVSIAPVVRHWGTDTIAERIGGLTFAFGPTSFAQNNPRLAETMYSDIVDRCAGPTLDLYTGVGVIACLAAQHVPHVRGVEVVEESIALAKANAAANGVQNVAFTCAPVRRWLSEELKAGLEAETVVLDPPRGGTAKKVIARVEALQPARILYVACNPSVLHRELDWFTEYRPVRLRAYDLFPQTPHVELVAELAHV